MSRRTSKKKTSAISIILLLIAVIGYFFLKPEGAADPAADAPHAVSVSQVPAYKNTPYAVINDGQPLFTEKEITEVTTDGIADISDDWSAYPLPLERNRFIDYNLLLK